MNILLKRLPRADKISAMRQVLFNSIESFTVEGNRKYADKVTNIQATATDDELVTMFDLLADGDKAGAATAMLGEPE